MDKLHVLPHHYLFFTFISSLFLYLMLGYHLITIAWLAAGIITSITVLIEDQLLKFQQSEKDL
ncbi:hypothetical protein [Robertmurraya korlensis]|uniref:hypothetical protein n=1 Tax=Robertmurraya korlensis TaxID=519977 RepID=UPI000827143D|nr:hypothetical protein [Robertmurraya korlensis]